MKATKVIGGLIAVFMATALFGGMVYAKPPAEESGTVDVARAEQLTREVGDAENPEGVFESLSTADQQLVLLYITPAFTESVSESTLYTQGQQTCRTNRHTLYKKNSLGIKIARYKSVTNWCYQDGQVVGSPHFVPSGYVYYAFRPFWDFIGHTYTTQSWGSNRSWHKDYAKGKFRGCIAFICSTWSPWITKQHWGDGRQDRWGDD